MPEEKNVIILIRQPPIGTLYPVEGLRMSVALSGDMEPLTVVVGEGVLAFLKDVDRTLYQHHLDFLTKIGLPIILDKKALDDRGLSPANLIDGLTIKEHSEILEMFAQVSAVISF